MCRPGPCSSPSPSHSGAVVSLRRLRPEEGVGDSERARGSFAGPGKGGLGIVRIVAAGEAFAKETEGGGLSGTGAVGIGVSGAVCNMDCQLSAWTCAECRRSAKAERAIFISILIPPGRLSALTRLHRWRIQVERFDLLRRRGAAVSANCERSFKSFLPASPQRHSGRHPTADPTADSSACRPAHRPRFQRQRTPRRSLRPSCRTGCAHR